MPLKTSKHSRKPNLFISLSIFENAYHSPNRNSIDVVSLLKTPIFLDDGYVMNVAPLSSCVVDSTRNTPNRDSIDCISRPQNSNELRYCCVAVVRYMHNRGQLLVWSMGQQYPRVRRVFLALTFPDSPSSVTSMIPAPGQLPWAA